MVRELRTTLALCALVLLIGSPLIFAPISQAGDTYLPMVFYVPPTPTPEPTPVPPALQTLTIQLREMKSGYVRDIFREVPNSEAAKTYPNAKAALAAFAQQGRETSWQARYTSTDYLFSDAAGVSNQVYRFLTPAGAVQGHAFIVAEIRRDDPGFAPFNVTVPCCTVVALRRSFVSKGVTLEEFDISIQYGRYVTDVDIIAVRGSVTVSRAIAYAQLALNHIYTTPQPLITNERASAKVQQSLPADVSLPSGMLTPH